MKESLQPLYWSFIMIRVVISRVHYGFQRLFWLFYHLFKHINAFSLHDHMLGLPPENVLMLKRLKKKWLCNVKKCFPLHCESLHCPPFVI